ncbi:CxC2 domain-containing protein [Mycena indigotica]|uniref:CxC2 domain-containing protein n=1 Tax=Mycena indigotica TaxID=2126181 RepID=A0A8H6S235_9AGAR|nr:CxC2 domain-containing protein [Mycena indigotica]KAF7291253.1 CxC2 domain-containing protein [Mycena indigotica]
MDACFRLKQRAISNEIRDPALSNGWAYMVEWEPYKKYLLQVGDQQEISTCTGLAALDYANSKFSRGYSVTGVGMGVCARHEFVQPTGVGDLQAGERFGNMDYIFGCILRHLHLLLRKLISYDIACQWWKNLFERLRKLPPMLCLLLVQEVFMKLFIFVVPKLHILGHTTTCQLLYSLNYTLGGGQTDGEGIERPWSMIGGVAASTRVSGPVFSKRLLTEFLLDQAERVPIWKAMVHEYKADGTKPNPYESKVQGLTEAQAGDVFTKSAQSTLWWIYSRSKANNVASLGWPNLKKAKSTTMKINLRPLRRALNKRILKVRQLQATYIPAALQKLKELEVAEDLLPEKVPLLPPSALTKMERENGGCLEGLVEIEQGMREAQCWAALVGLRNQLLVKYRLLLYKANHSRNQTMNTRSRSLVARNENKVLFFSQKYQAAWLALVLIAGGIESNVGWRRLRKEDIRCLEDSEELVKKQVRGERAEARRAWDEKEMRGAGIIPLNIHRVQNDKESDEDDELVGTAILSGESRRVISWIWTTAGMTGSDIEVEEALQIEWVKAYARVRRWNKEVMLLREEWRRLPESFAHEERVWKKRATSVPVGSIPTADAEGMIVYALKHVDMYYDLARRAEVIRTQPKLGKGVRRPTQREGRPIGLPAESPALSEVEDAEVDGIIERDESDDQGNISDEELLLTGKIDDW